MSPPTSLSTLCWLRALRFTLSPHAAWRALVLHAPSSVNTFASFLLPLLPAAAASLVIALALAQQLRGYPTPPKATHDRRPIVLVFRL